MRRTLLLCLGVLSLAASTGCDGTGRTPPARPTQPDVVAAEQRARLSEAQLAEIGRSRTARLLGSLPAVPAAGPLPFEVTRADYYEQVASALKLSAPEKALLAKNGFVIVDHDQRYTFTSAYLGVYTRDLPVLVTTDSILHAYHRSYDGVMRMLESSTMAPTLRDMLGRVRGTLLEQRKKGGVDETVSRDVDDTLRVALALLSEPESPAFTSLHKEHYRGDRVPELIDAALEARGAISVQLRGQPRLVDFTQFKPRGHYTASEELSRYFRAMMWLGRADTGFWFTSGSPTLQEQVDTERELRAASYLARVLEDSRSLDAYRDLDSIYRLLVGESANLTLDVFLPAVHRARGSSAALLADLERQAGAKQRIQSSIHVVPPGSAGHAELPMLFQFFGQRHTLDSEVLSSVVHDRLVVDGAAVERMMPSPLDVAAAFGNDEAVRLLEPELVKWAYAEPMQSLRTRIAALPAASWEQSLTAGWLSALRTLHAPGEHGAWPALMQRTAWQRKMLGTELASWSELRRDNVLATKESVTMTVSCEYPYGYVEPYVEFYGGMAKLARKSEQLLRHGLHKGSWSTQAAAEHFARFAQVMDQLGELAQKELRHAPFDADEQTFLKQVT